LIERVPTIRWLKTREADFDFLSFAEADRLIATADPEWRAMIIVALRCGLRIGELRALRWRDLELGPVNPALHVRQAMAREVLGTPKSEAGRRTVPLCRSAAAALRAHLRHLHSEIVFAQPDTGEILTEAMTRTPLRRAQKAAGLRHLGWHVLRHTFASHLVMRGAKLEAVKELMGHSTIDQTMRYVHLSPQFRQDTIALLDSNIPERQTGGVDGI
jgi:integrase